ncbi:MAG: hypothetical protein V4724_18440 [Pseudomonadota bacterium]
MSTLLKSLSLAAALSLPLAAAAQKAEPAAGAPAVPQSHSVEQADARLAEVVRARAGVQSEFATSEQVCYGKFFVNHCLDQAKEKRRAALADLRAIEVEAHHFKRLNKVEKRDQELAERLKKDDEQLARRIETPATPHAERPATVPQGKPGPSVERRQAEHDARLKRLEAKDAADAGKRAENVAAFERKRVESEHRQAQVVAKKQAREAKEKKRAEDEAAAAAKKAASTPKK